MNSNTFNVTIVEHDGVIIELTEHSDVSLDDYTHYVNVVWGIYKPRSVKVQQVQAS